MPSRPCRFAYCRIHALPRRRPAGFVEFGLYRLGLSGHGFATQAASLRVAA
ncbi:MAG: hypothetical protein VB143_07850 [Burkholderia sp.]